MLIICPKCEMSYEVGPESLGPAGRPVRCTRCRTVWHAEGVDAQPALSPAEVTEMAAADAFPTPSLESDRVDEFPGSAVESPGFPDDPGFAMHPSLTGAEPSLAEDALRIEDAPSILPPGIDDDLARHEGPFPITGGSIETFAARRARKKAQKKRTLPRLPALRWPIAPLPTALLALGACCAVILGWRTEVVRLMPQTASFYETIGLGVNLRGVVFENVKTTRDVHEGIPVLAVEGEIVSVTHRSVEIPRLRFSVRNARGSEIYSWTALASRPLATAGERVPFRSRLASPPAEAHDIVVRFHNRRDLSATMR